MRSGDGGCLAKVDGFSAETDSRCDDGRGRLEGDGGKG